MEDQVLDSRQEIFRAGTRENPGRYYFVQSRKIVPGQIKNGVDNPDFNINKYRVVPKPDRRIQRDTTDYKTVLQSGEPAVIKSVNISSITSIALNYGWRLSTKCARALNNWGKGQNEIMDFFKKQRDSYQEENYLDYDPKRNTFVCRCRDEKK